MMSLTMPSRPPTRTRRITAGSGSRKGGRESPAMWDAIARARPAASCRRHSLEREGDTASRIRSSPLETLIAPRGTDGSNPASSSEESCGRWSPMGLGREQRSRSCEPGRNLREARGVKNARVEVSALNSAVPCVAMAPTVSAEIRPVAVSGPTTSRREVPSSA